jgi:23S rRNA (uracil1939-C5)-methyltransferase
VLEGAAVEVLERSLERVDAREPHYLTCSPWQVLSWKAEQEWKRRTALETWEHVGKFELPGEVELVGDEEQQFGYRTKMEYSVTAAAEGSAGPDGMVRKLSLAFFQRGRHVLAPIDGCVLAAEPTNAQANRVLRWLESEGLGAPAVKSILVRADGAGHVLIAVFLRERRQFKQVLALDDQLLGLTAYFSNPQSPASTPDEQLLQLGQDYLDVPVRGHVLRHGLLGFFQVNAPIFEKTLADMEPWLKDAAHVLDLYGGVGSIGIGAVPTTSKLTLVELDAAAVEHAKRNYAAAGRTNAEAVASTAESALSYISSDVTVVLDPPRAGLHPDVVERLLFTAPPRIVYLSCNVSTQARDVALLSSKYAIKFARLYNYFPRTPHVEGLLVLDRR